MKKFYKATDSTGRVHTRCTASRTYSHAVICGSTEALKTPLGPFKAEADLATEPTPQGNQYVIPGCEKDQTRGPAQTSLW